MRDWDADENGAGPLETIEFLGVGAVVTWVYITLVRDLAGRLVGWIVGS